MRCLILPRLLCLCACVLPTIASAQRGAITNAEVVVNVDLTEDGRKIPRPTAQDPAYYVPVILGYQEGGKVVAGEEPPPRKEMLRLVGQALAREGYVLQALRPDAAKTLPSLIIALEWGYLNPDIVETGALDLSTGEGGTMSPAAIRNDPTQATSVDFNQPQMLTLVAGSAIYRQALFSENEWQKLREAASEGRYFIILSAYDFEASVKGEQKLLWRARMSASRHRVWLDEVMPALVAAGAPHFGRQTDKPSFVIHPIRKGRVEVGDTVVQEDDVKLPADSKAPPPPEK